MGSELVTGHHSEPRSGWCQVTTVHAAAQPSTGYAGSQRSRPSAHGWELTRYARPVGVSDSLKITLTCPVCGLTETDRILDKGSGWSGPSWREPTFEKFEVVISGSRKTDYEVSGVCPSCKVAAQVSEQYGI